MLLVEFIIAGVILAAGFFFLERKFAKMNEAKNEITHNALIKVLEDLGARKIEYTEGG